ncbi:MAG: RHS repeat-associated core domain-containing protein [Chloroflexi bacterium]|nr:RHS repeat-associated core domain-containing protein [Chloroflexota bacterium]
MASFAMSFLRSIPCCQRRPCRERVSGEYARWRHHLPARHHLGSVSAATSSGGAVVNVQTYTPWGEVRTGDIPQPTRDFTGQRRDGTGLLFYQARYYDPGLGLFVSPDTIVPGTASGAGGAADTVGPDAQAGLAALTVGFHEPVFGAQLGAEHRALLANGFFGRETPPSAGPANPQALNRYAYVLNNPVRYTDPTGHNAEVAEMLLKAAQRRSRACRSRSLWPPSSACRSNGLCSISKTTASNCEPAIQTASGIDPAGRNGPKAHWPASSYSMTLSSRGMSTPSSWSRSSCGQFPSARWPRTRSPSRARPARSSPAPSKIST